ncbi:hypothetical protein KSP39_PZI018761 [Platanthera zijinensis]|uniref:Uncharacterized protein n=1 Tax=Platanthera zijinensis TaxID=2320716 RepID=A0AAP0B4D6_9ASPA
MGRDEKTGGGAEPNSETGRGRSPAQERTAKNGRLPASDIPEFFPDDGGGYWMEKSDACRPLGVFEFPWQNEAGSLAPEPDGWSLPDVFFSSLVDGSSAAIGFPGDRLSPPSASPIFIACEIEGSSPSDGDVESVDCIWSCALRQPLSAVYWRACGT